MKDRLTDANELFQFAEKSETSWMNIATIFGGIIAGLVVILTVVFAVLCYYR